jgi:hypothetical protein
VFSIRHHISVVLLVCFLPVITPKEFIHAFLGHEDTECNGHPALTIDKVHQHCKILQITASSFLGGLKKSPLPGIFRKASYFFSAQTFISGVSIHLSFLRAPPVNSI